MSMFQSLKNGEVSLKREILAGVTTFVTMAYIIVVNPTLLKQAGVPFDIVFIATIAASIVGCLLMAFYANYPIAVAPGMGMNAYFAFTVATHQGKPLDYHIAFATVFIASILFVILSLTPLRTHLINAIPDNLKHAITAGIGLFIAFIGLRQAGIIAADPTNLVRLGNLHSEAVLLALLGLLVTVALMAFRVHGALFIGMVIIGIISFFLGNLHFDGVVKLPPTPELVVWNPVSAIGDIIQYGLYAAVFTFVLVTIFDTTGTVLGLAKQAGLMKDGSNLPRAGRAFVADSIATLVGSIFGTTPTSAYVESAAGIAAGGRSGWTALTVAVLFIISMFFFPVVQAVSSVPAITAPALVIVGSLMVGHVQHINWSDFDEAFPAFLVILTMPLTNSIANGIALGFVFYPVLKLAQGKWRQIHPLVYIFAVLFLLLLIFLPH